MTNQLTNLATTLGVDAGSVRWLAEYIARQAEGREELLNDPAWIAGQVRGWLAMANDMTERAFNNHDLACRVVLDQVRG